MMKTFCAIFGRFLLFSGNSAGWIESSSQSLCVSGNECSNTVALRFASNSIHTGLRVKSGINLRQQDGSNSCSSILSFCRTWSSSRGLHTLEAAFAAFRRGLGLGSYKISGLQAPVLRGTGSIFSSTTPMLP
eukprot:TRINITY_DN26112_c0_g1_i1.p1 TRINITY_DN26112_c0_g1~~TRINITY_DN26112_c0_g1_i1.p1  ORF type:complete len:132 (+),score=16.94 TRINITY_DN26112_c0_g1_i1:74-469(+)